MRKPFLPVFCFSLLLLIGAANQTRAQRLVFIFGHLTYNAPVQSNLKDNYKFGAGAEAGAGLGNGKTFVTATTGYTKFNSRKGSGAGNFGYVPIKFGIRQYVFAKLLFLNANAGMAVIKPKDEGSMSRFTADVGVGAQLAGLDLGINYDGFAAKDPSGWASWISFKAGFRFGL